VNSIRLDEDSFWEWMSLGIPGQESGSPDFLPKSNRGHVRLLSTMMENQWESIALNRLSSKSSLKTARTLDSLSRHIPRKYLLELQFCLAAYSSVFATLFPSMLSHLDDLGYIEWLLHMEPDNERYRDHLVHMFRVAFVCNRLMQLQAIRQKAKKFQFSSAHFLGWCEETLHKNPNEWDTLKKDRILYAAIYLAAIFHDVGYGYYYLNLYRQRLTRVLPSLIRTETTADLQHGDMSHMRASLAAEFVKKYHNAFKATGFPANEEVILSGFIRDNIVLNHSVASTMFLEDLAGNLYDRRAISDELYAAFHLAAEAAMLHDMTEDHKWLHFSTGSRGQFLDRKKQREVPIAALLCFADNLELRGRPRFEKRINDLECTILIQDEHENRTNIEYDASKKCLTLEPKGLIPENDFIFDLEKKHFVLFGIPVVELDSSS
jgi:hypothetical protein